MDINESAKWHDSSTVNIGYQWWCLDCQAYHYGPICPIDHFDNKPEPDVKIFIGNIRYDFCPHCGQLIRQGGWT